MCHQRLDARDTFPPGMEAYLGFNGWHFSKRMCEWAVSLMRDAKGEKIRPMTKEQLDGLLTKHGITLQNDKGYDAVYVVNMCQADYWGSSITEEVKMVKFVKDYIDDPDGYDGLPFTRWYADMIGSGTPITWEDVL